MLWDLFVGVSSLHAGFRPFVSVSVLTFLIINKFDEMRRYANINVVID